ncbi:MAG: hypothetical protein NVS3B26_15510 [Mycobacteriales bacterium]
MAARWRCLRVPAAGAHDAFRWRVSRASGWTGAPPTGARASRLRRACLSALRPAPVPAPKWFYNAQGSRLFDKMTRLPEYYPARRERSLLHQQA